MSLRNRHFLKLLDCSPTELEQLIQASLTFKRLRMAGHERSTLSGRSLALLFGKVDSQISWTVQSAAASQGLDVSAFGPTEFGLSSTDSRAHNAVVLGRLFEALAVFGLDQERMEELARQSGAPVCNLGSGDFQPLTVLADLMTIAERSAKSLSEVSVVLLGDGTNSLAQSFMVGASKLGMDLRICGPKDLRPDENLTETCLALAAETGAQIRIFHEAAEAIKGADFVLSHSWIKRDDTDWQQRAKTLLPYRATTDLLAHSGQNRCHLIHHLPFILGEETEFSQKVTEELKVDGLEVSRELFESLSNLCFEQAENQLHCCKAVLVKLFS